MSFCRVLKIDRMVGTANWSNTIMAAKGAWVVRNIQVFQCGRIIWKGQEISTSQTFITIGSSDFAAEGFHGGSVPFCLMKVFPGEHISAPDRLAGTFPLSEHQHAIIRQPPRRAQRPAGKGNRWLFASPTPSPYRTWGDGDDHDPDPSCSSSLVPDLAKVGARNGLTVG